MTILDFKDDKNRNHQKKKLTFSLGYSLQVAIFRFLQLQGKSIK